ncbi:MAG: hypothetical protein IKD55_02290 [Sediminibacterium sp.]|nr:hypothetical protein [Sediminibacterium sp.]
MTRTIEELLKLDKYDGLTHDEVMLLINQKVFEAEVRAHDECLQSEIIKMNQSLIAKQEQSYVDSLQMIKDCKLDFSQAQTKLKTGGVNNG